MDWNRPIRLASYGMIFFFLLGVDRPSLAQMKPVKVHFAGTITDADGKPVANGFVHASFKGGDFKNRFSNGQYDLPVEFDGQKFPVMVKLTYFVDGNKFPPRFIEHLSPRLPQGESQRVHIVVYSDEQLKRASLDMLFLEGQELEKTVFYWLQAEKPFKDAYHAHFSASLLDSRRQLICDAWGSVKDAKVPAVFNQRSRSRFSDTGELALKMKEFLPSESRESPGPPGQGQYVAQASARLVKLIDQANRDGYKLHDDTFSIGGGWLKQDGKNWLGLFTVQLAEGKEYRFLAAGDKDAKEVDLQVTDPENLNMFFAASSSMAPGTVVSFTPKMTRRYLVRIRLPASQEQLPCVCLAMVMSKK